MFENEKNIFDNDFIPDLYDENGNSVIEAAFIVTTVLFVIALIIMLGFYHYQVTLLQTTADEVATSIARTYTYEKKDPITGYIGKDELDDFGFTASCYWLIGDIGFISTSKNQNEKDEAKKMAEQLLSRRRFMRSHGKTDVNVEIGHSELALFQNEIKVTISESYYIPFAQLLGVKDSVLKVTKSSKAICYDHIGANGYYQTFNTIAEIFGKSETGKLIKNITDIIGSIMNAFKDGRSIADVIFKGSK